MSINWYDTCIRIHELVKDDADTSNVDIDAPDTWYDYANEFADGCSWVIYYSESRALWADSAAVQDYEEETSAWHSGDADIDARITSCVYAATVNEVMAALQELAEAAIYEEDAS